MRKKLGNWLVTKSYFWLFYYIMVGYLFLGRKYSNRLYHWLSYYAVSLLFIDVMYICFKFCFSHVGVDLNSRFLWIMITSTSIGNVTPVAQTLSAGQITPNQTTPDCGEGSRPLTWLSEKRRRTARSLRSSFPYPKTPAGARPLHSKCKVICICSRVSVRFRLCYLFLGQNNLF